MRNHPVSRRRSKWGFFRDGRRSSQVSSYSLANSPRIPSPHTATRIAGTRPCAQGEGRLVLHCSLKRSVSVRTGERWWE